jgi:undecaprenyl-diphosphatase
VTRNLLLAAAGLWLVVLASAVGVSALAALNDKLPADEPITDWLQDNSLPGEDISDLVRTITGTEVVLATGAAVALVLWQRGYRRQAVLLAAGLILLAVLQPLLKEIVDRPRPDPDLVRRRAGFDSPSFPSGHVLPATFLYGSLLYFSLVLPLGRIARGIVLTVCILVIVATPIVNVWLGVHWPSDILGSWLWALVLLLPVVVLDRSEASDT